MTTTLVRRDQVIDQALLRTIYRDELDVRRTDGMLHALQRLRYRAKKNPALSWLKPYAKGELTVGTFLRIMDCKMMNCEHGRLPMLMVHNRWNRSYQHKLHELAVKLSEHLS